MVQKKNHPTIEIPQTNSRVGVNSFYDGVLRFSTSLSILGAVKGEIIGGELLVVHPNAKVEGDILVDYLLVIGSVNGNIHARRGVFFFESAIVRGSVLSTVIRMQTGVDFEGKCNLIEDNEIDIFSISHDTFRASVFDQFVHKIDEISTK